MTEHATPRSRLLARLHVPDTLLRRLGWATSGYGIVQAIRFASNLVLTRMLAPELFGIMILVISLRTGIELFTDIGVAQNVISNRNSRDPRFYNTAWTLQVIRGLLLALLSFAFLPIISQMYDQEKLHGILPFVSLFFLITGFVSIGLPLAVKAMATKRTAIFEISSTLMAAIALIGCAWVRPDIWGLLIGNMIASFLPAVISYLVMPDIKHRFVLDRQYVREIVGFGKWVFVSSIVYFLATNFDRLMLAKYVSFTMLGIYGIARTLGDVFIQFSSKLGTEIIFPSVANTELRGPELQAKVAHRRLQFLGVAVLGLAVFIALSDLIIRILYDPRYMVAGQVLPWVGMAAWFSILCTLNENVLLGLGKPFYSAFGNGAKLVVLVVLLPVGVTQFGILGAALAMAGSELARYICLTAGQSRERVGFVRQDVLATLLLIGIALAIRSVTYEASLTGAPTTLFTFLTR